jgi:glycosyltransferase involved in cell wall biosynthesis
VRILIYSRDFSPSIGGVQTVVADLARGLASFKDGPLNLEVTVVTQTEGGGDVEFPFRVVRRPEIRDLWRLIRKANIVHLAGPALLPMLMGLSLGRPVVVEHHGFQTACPNGQMFHEPTKKPCPGYYMKARYAECLGCNRKALGFAGSLRLLSLTPVRRWLANRAAANLTPTDWLGSILRLRHMETIPHSATIGESQAPLRPSNSTFACQGRLVTTKGFDIVLEAARQLTLEGLKVDVKIIGDGPEKERLIAQASQSSIAVEFLDRVPDERLGSALATAATVVMPSLGGEVFGLVAAENMLRGKLLIVSDIGSLREIIGNTGLVFPAGDAAGLASCMRSVLQKPELAESLGTAARKRALEVFQPARMIQAHVSVYKRVLGYSGS